MPLYDNIVDALALTVDRGSHTVDIDNTGATMETNEATYNEGEPSVWLKFEVDPSANFGVTFQTAYISGTVSPYLDFYNVPSNGWDPASPDFSLLGFVGGFFVGDGTNTPPPVTRTGIANTSFGTPGLWYVFVGDWNFAGGEGVQRITYTIDADPPTPPPPPPAGPDPYLQARFPTE